MSAMNPKKRATTAQTAALYPLRFATSALATTKTTCTTKKSRSSTGPMFITHPPLLAGVASIADDGSAPYDSGPS